MQRLRNIWKPVNGSLRSSQRQQGRQTQQCQYGRFGALLAFVFLVLLIPTISSAQTVVGDSVLIDQDFLISIPDGALQSGESVGAFTRTFDASSVRGFILLSDELVFDTSYATDLAKDLQVELEWKHNLFNKVDDPSRIRAFKLLLEFDSESGSTVIGVHALPRFELLESGVRFWDTQLSSYVLAVDTVLPVVEIDMEGVIPAYQTTIPLNFTLNDNVANLKVTMQEWTGESTAPKTTLLPVGTGVRNIRSTISQSKSGVDGFVFQLRVEDGTDTVWSEAYELYYPRPAVRSLKAHRGGEYAPVSLPLVFQRNETNTGGSAIIAFSDSAEMGAQPVIPATDLNEIQTLLTDSLGEYLPDSWRAYVNDQTDFAEITSPLAKEFIQSPGAVWLHSGSRDLRFDADSGYYLPLLQPVAIKIRPGWNLLSSPWNFSLNWAAVLMNSDSVDAREISGPWLWDNQNRTWSDPDTTMIIPAFQGGLLYNHSADTLNLKMRAVVLSDATNDAGYRGHKISDIPLYSALTKVEGDRIVAFYADSLKQFEITQTLASGLSRALPKIPQLNNASAKTSTAASSATSTTSTTFTVSATSSMSTTSATAPSDAYSGGSFAGSVLQLQHNQQPLQKLWSNQDVIVADVQSLVSGAHYLQASYSDGSDFQGVPAENNEWLAYRSHIHLPQVYLCDTSSQTAVKLPAYSSLKKNHSYQIVLGDSALIAQHLEDYQFRVIEGTSVSHAFVAHLTRTESGVKIQWSSPIPGTDWQTLASAEWVLDAWNAQGRLQKILWEGRPVSSGVFVPLEKRWLRNDVRLRLRLQVREE